MDHKCGHRLAEIKCALKTPGVNRIVILCETWSSLHRLLAEFRRLYGRIPIFLLADWGLGAILSSWSYGPLISSHGSLLLQSFQENFSPVYYQILCNWKINTRVTTIPSYLQVMLTLGHMQDIYTGHIHQWARVSGAILAFCLPQSLLHMTWKIKMDQRLEHRN